ncbi:hypothetical protein LJC07_07390 [Christensenellaceae bacterium OttesenSCG-928-L17]|nr:hypothetical protein [Christensenellaceae bacterium OttesenSCG-928-L17]
MSNNGIVESVADFGEGLVDTLVDNEIVNAIPVVKTAVAIIGTSKSIQGSLFAKRLMKFLKGIEYIPTDEILDEINKIDSNKKYRVKAGEKLLSIIDKANDEEDAELIAKLYGVCVKKKISYDDFLRCSQIIINVGSPNIRRFIVDGLNNNKPTVAKELTYSGLYDIDSSPIQATTQDQEEIEKNQEKRHLNQPWMSALDAFSLNLTSWQQSIPSSIARVFGGQQEPEKYHTKVKGGDIILRVSDLGKIVYEHLHNIYVEGVE